MPRFVKKKLKQNVLNRPQPLTLREFYERRKKVLIFRGTGGLGDIASYCFLAAALDHGSVMLVTALQVTVLLFALPIYARVTAHRITGWEWLWAMVLAGALAVVIMVGDPEKGLPRGALGDWFIVAIVLGPALALCVLGARIWRVSGRR